LELLIEHARSISQASISFSCQLFGNGAVASSFLTEIAEYLSKNKFELSLKQHNLARTYSSLIFSEYKKSASLRTTVPLGARGKGLSGLVIITISPNILAKPGALVFAFSTVALTTLLLVKFKLNRDNILYRASELCFIHIQV
jgi:hypothetical protein